MVYANKSVQVENAPGLEYTTNPISDGAHTKQQSHNTALHSMFECLLDGATWFHERGNEAQFKPSKSKVNEQRKQDQKMADEQKLSVYTSSKAGTHIGNKKQGKCTTEDQEKNITKQNEKTTVNERATLVRPNTTLPPIK